MLTIFLKPKEADSRITLKVYIRTSDGDTLCVRVTKMSGYGNTNSRYLLCVTRRWGALFLILFYFFPCGVIFSNRKTSHSLRRNHGFQEREGVFSLALLSIPNHQLLRRPGALGTVYVQHHLTNHCCHGRLHRLCLHSHPHPPGLGIFLQNMRISQFNFYLISLESWETAWRVHVLYNLST